MYFISQMFESSVMMFQALINNLREKRSLITFSTI